MNEGKPQIGKQNNISHIPTIEREWAAKLSGEVVKLLENLQNKEQATVVDCGAGEGRHSIEALKQGVGKVISIERDEAQSVLLKLKLGENKKSEIINGNTIEELEKLNNDSIDGIIDCGMSHYFQTEEQRAKFAELVKEKLKRGGLYSITHFSENEKSANKTLHKATLKELKSLFPEDSWDDNIMSWREESWESGGNKHFAYKSVLKKK